jgi:hypothetical protein
MSDTGMAVLRLPLAMGVDNETIWFPRTRVNRSRITGLAAFSGQSLRDCL